MHFRNQMCDGQLLHWQSILGRALLCLTATLLLVACTQQAADPSGSAKPSSANSSEQALPPGGQTAGPRWQDLTPAQQLILKPLTAVWSSLDSSSKGKWIAFTLNYGARSAAEQQRMQERMGEWAALTPIERQRARLNFAQTKKRPQSDRTAEWEAYQGLSPEEKKAFEKASPAKPVGAAVAIVPTAPDKLTPVPVTRHTPVNDDATAHVVRPILNPKTLLPAPVIPQEPSSAPVSENFVGPVAAP